MPQSILSTNKQKPSVPSLQLPNSNAAKVTNATSANKSPRSWSQNVKVEKAISEFLNEKALSDKICLDSINYDSNLVKITIQFNSRVFEKQFNHDIAPRPFLELQSFLKSNNIDFTQSGQRLYSTDPNCPLPFIITGDNVKKFLRLLPLDQVADTKNESSASVPVHPEQSRSRSHSDVSTKSPVGAEAKVQENSKISRDRSGSDPARLAHQKPSPVIKPYIPTQDDKEDIAKKQLEEDAVKSAKEMIALAKKFALVQSSLLGNETNSDIIKIGSMCKTLLEHEYTCAEKCIKNNKANYVFCCNHVKGFVGLSVISQAGYLSEHKLVIEQAKAKETEKNSSRQPVAVQQPKLQPDTTSKPKVINPTPSKQQKLPSNNKHCPQNTPKPTLSSEVLNSDLVNYLNSIFTEANKSYWNTFHTKRNLFGLFGAAPPDGVLAIRVLSTEFAKNINGNNVVDIFNKLKTILDGINSRNSTRLSSTTKFYQEVQRVYDSYITQLSGKMSIHQSEFDRSGIH